MTETKFSILTKEFNKLSESEKYKVRLAELVFLYLHKKFHSAGIDIRIPDPSEIQDFDFGDNRSLLISTVDNDFNFKIDNFDLDDLEAIIASIKGKKVIPCEEKPSKKQKPSR